MSYHSWRGSFSQQINLLQQNTFSSLFLEMDKHIQIDNCLSKIRPPNICMPMNWNFLMWWGIHIFTLKIRSIQWIRCPSFGCVHVGKYHIKLWVAPALVLRFLYLWRLSVVLMKQQRYRILFFVAFGSRNYWWHHM